MIVRPFVAFFLILAIAGCKNEPYEHFPLGVTSLVNKVSNQTSAFTYRNKKLSSFLTKLGTDSLIYIKFHYTSGELTSMSIDSTSTSIKQAYVYNNGDVVIDSIFNYTPETITLVSARKVTYSSDRQPVFVELKTWTPDAETGEIVATDNVANLVWDGGNVVRLVVADFSTGERNVTKDDVIDYDGNSCIYTGISEYLYTLKLEDLFWLSANNPISFNNGSNETFNSYQYNRLGYPSSYKSPLGTTYGMSYTQVR